MFSLHKRIDSRLKFVLKATATVLLAAYVVHRLDTEQLIRAVVGQDPLWLGLGVLISATFVATRIAKWRLLTAANGLRAGYRVLARLMLFSLMLGIVTPGRVGETISVTAFEPPERSRALLLWLYDRIGELCVVLLFGVPGCLVFFGRTGVAIALLFLLIAISGICVMHSPRFRAFLSKLFLLNRIGKIRDVLSGELRVPSSYWALSVLAYVQAYLLIVAFILGSQPVTDWRMVLLLPIVTLSNLVSVTVGGLGIREGLAAAVLPLGGVTAEAGAAAFFLSFLFTRVVAGFVGVLWTVTYNLSHVAKRGPSHEDPGP